MFPPDTKLFDPEACSRRLQIEQPGSAFGSLDDTPRLAQGVDEVLALHLFQGGHSSAVAGPHLCARCWRGHAVLSRGGEATLGSRRKLPLDPQHVTFRQNHSALERT